MEFPLSQLPSGATLSLRVAVVHGARPGPTVWISGAVHGDELNGIEICRQLLARLDPKSLRGTLLAIPIVNSLGVLNQRRALPDGRDLNRSFPGSARGSLAGRLAHVLVTQIVDRCDFGMDFHSGSGGRDNLPQVRVDFSEEKSMRAAEAFGAPVLLHAKMRSGSLRSSAAKRGVPSLIYEGGEVLRFDERVIHAGVSGAVRVMRHLGMVDEADAAETGARCRSSRWVRARLGGIFRPHVELGDRVVSGDVLATVTDAFNQQPRPIRSPLAGIVIGLLRRPIVNGGDALLHVATESPA